MLQMISAIWRITIIDYLLRAVLHGQNLAGLMQFPDDVFEPESSDEEQDVTQLYSTYEQYVTAQVTLDDLFYLEVSVQTGWGRPT